MLTLSHPDGTEIAVIERNLVAEGSLAAEELREFHDDIGHCAPASAVRWLRDYFSRIRSIYAFQILSGTDAEGGWEIFGALRNALWQRSTGIFQADGEGFSNEQGYHILWQFSDSVSGACWMGVLQDGAWVHFQIDLGNHDHREAFFKGRVPDGAIRA